MRYLSVILFSLLLSSCGSATNLNIDAKFQSYFDSFKEELRIRNVDIKINNLTITTNSALKTQIMAVCIRSIASAPVIQVNPTTWPDKEADREGIIYHELGHCILGRVHTTEMIVDILPSSQTRGGYECLGEKYSYNQNSVNYMPMSLMHPCASATTFLYSVLNVDPVFDLLARSYYVDELIRNRVIGYSGGF